MECFNKRDRFLFKVKQRKILNNLLEEINVNNYHILHAHSLYTNGHIAMNIKKRFGIPYIVAVRSTDITVFYKKMIHLKKIGNEILYNAKAIVFLSQSYFDLMIKKYIPIHHIEMIKEKSYIIPSGINKFWLKKNVNAKKLNNKKNINLLHVGVINKRKNITTTAKAVELLINEGYQIKLTAVGKVKDEYIYRNLKNKNYINFLPQKSKEDLKNIYNNNDILVMPSISETFGLVYPEAMSQGLPVIYTKDQGFDKQFDEGKVGYSVNANNPSEIVKSIKLIEKNYHKMSNLCIKNAEEFDWNSISEIYKNLYLKIVN